MKNILNVFVFLILIIGTKVNAGELKTSVFQFDSENEDQQAISLGFNYNFDKSSKIENQILKAGTFNNGLNFINLYKMIAKSANKSEEIDKKFSNVNYKPSDLIREVYDDAFFVKSLGLKKQNISEFLLYCDDKFPSKFLFKKSNEFQLLDFLIKQSDKFKKILERS